MEQFMAVAAARTSCLQFVEGYISLGKLMNTNFVNYFLQPCNFSLLFRVLGDNGWRGTLEPFDFLILGSYFNPKICQLHEYVSYYWV